MSSPKTDRCAFAVSTATHTIPASQPDTGVGGAPDAAFTARALVLVAALSGGVWYLVWSISLHLMTGH
jgi:hypothetical protein